LKTEPYEVEVLFVGEYDSVLEKERELHLHHDVVANDEFFNLAIATTSTYSNPEYGTYRSVSSGKVARLPRNHPSVISGKWVGVTKGRPMAEGVKVMLRKRMTGKNNPFWGKTHSKEKQALISKKIAAYYQTPSGKGVRKTTGARISKLMKGVPKTKAHRKAIGRKGFEMIKNANTGEVLRIPTSTRKEYDAAIWKTPACLRKKKLGICPVCGKVGDLNAAFMKWHFTNCREA